MQHYALIFLIGLFLIVSSCKTLYPAYESGQQIPSTDYANLDNWAAHPDKLDNADKIPAQSELSDQSDLPADVFFIHPTIYTKFKGNDTWNPSLDNEELNKDVDESTILFQASAFNEAGRVFAPRYRQAHIYGYFTEDKINAKKAFEIAYKDVKEAFEYYLEHHNNGRPIIIAGHSQGTTHAGPLIKEFFDGRPLQKQLVAAYLLGMPVKKDYFNNISPCQDSTDIGCFISWRTFKHGYIPKKIAMGDSILATNPLSWQTNDSYVPKTANKGGLTYNFDHIFPNFADAQVHQGILWTHKPKFPFSFLYRSKNYHVADVNFFYMNVRKNAALRVKEFISKK
jgi:hypothetical protein